jgi:hypothetical protein
MVKMATIWEQCSRLVPYWSTIIATSWILAFLYLWVSDEATNAYSDIIEPVRALCLCLYAFAINSTTSNCSLDVL